MSNNTSEIGFISHLASVRGPAQNGGVLKKHKKNRHAHASVIGNTVLELKEQMTLLQIEVKHKTVFVAQPGNQESRQKGPPKSYDGIRFRGLPDPIVKKTR